MTISPRKYNEKNNARDRLTFFSLLFWYRVQEAGRILTLNLGSLPFYAMSWSAVCVRTSPTSYPEVLCPCEIYYRCLKFFLRRLKFYIGAEQFTVAEMIYPVQKLNCFRRSCCCSNSTLACSTGLNLRDHFPFSILTTFSLLQLLAVMYITSFTVFPKPKSVFSGIN